MYNGYNCVNILLYIYNYSLNIYIIGYKVTNDSDLLIIR